MAHTQPSFSPATDSHLNLSPRILEQRRNHISVLSIVATGALFSRFDRLTGEIVSCRSSLCQALIVSHSSAVTTVETWAIKGVQDFRVQYIDVDMQAFIPKFALLREQARAVVPKNFFDYVDGGADDEITLQRNLKAWRKVKLMPRVLRKLTKADTSCKLFGERLAAPLIIAPMAAHGWIHEEGECATARAAEQCGIPLCVSLFASKGVGDIAKSGCTSVVYQQLYMLKDESFVKTFLKDAYEQGCRCVVLTVDAPVMGNREKDVENKFKLDGTHLAILKRKDWSMHAETSDNFVKVFHEGIVDCDWSIVKWIKDVVDVKVLLKGILHPADAVLAVEHGADGIIVSNHGGRQLDTAVTAVDVLPQIAAAVNKRIPILVDGGIQRGTDIIKSLAMGASAVLIGRPILYALAAGGTEKVVEVLEGLKEELARGLLLCGCSSIDEITSDVLFHEP